MSSNSRFDTCTKSAVIQSAFVPVRLSLSAPSVARPRTMFVRRRLRSFSRPTIWTPRPLPTIATFVIPTSVRRRASPEPRVRRTPPTSMLLLRDSAADAANKFAQEAYNRVDSLSGVVANLDNYKPALRRQRELSRSTSMC